MPQIIPDGYAKATFSHTMLGDPEPMLCSIGLKLDGPANLAMAEALLTAWTNAWKPHCGTFVTFQGIRLEEGTGAEPIIYEVSGTTSGDLAGTAFLPPNCAYLLRKFTAQGGRKHKGRMYLPFASEGNVDHLGFMDAETTDTLTEAAQDWQVATIALSGVEELVVLHEQAGLAPTVITNVSIDRKIATQRRRLRA